jgi:hypothetical protein
MEFACATIVIEKLTIMDIEQSSSAGKISPAERLC